MKVSFLVSLWVESHQHTIFLYVDWTQKGVERAFYFALVFDNKSPQQSVRTIHLKLKFKFQVKKSTLVLGVGLSCTVFLPQLYLSLLSVY